jgi:hypothetical protein
MLTYDGLNRWVKAGDAEAAQLGGSVDDGGVLWCSYGQGDEQCSTMG